MQKEPAWKYLPFTCLVAAMNLVGIFIALFTVELCAAASVVFYYAVEKQAAVTGSLVLLWTCLAMGFMHGACLRRSVSAVAVPAGWLVTGGLACFVFRSEHYVDRCPVWPVLLLPMVIVPALAALSAWHGSRWATRRDRREFVWLGVMLLVFSAFFIYNRELFGLVPDQIRWRIWNCPL